MQHLDRVNHGVLVAFRRQIVAHSERLGTHSTRVGELAANLGRELGVGGSELFLLRWAGELHDLGKTLIPRSLLFNAGPFDEFERAVIEKHPVVGHDLLVEMSPDFHDLALAVRSHHERWDGLGYPDHLSQEAICDIARLVAIADVYDALTSDRPYRSMPFSHDSAVNLIMAESGTHFDPTFVDAFLELERRGLVGGSRTAGRVSAQSGGTRIPA